MINLVYNKIAGRLRSDPARMSWMLAFCAALLLAEPSGVQAANPSEYEVKAAFLFNFIKFVEWPVPMGPKDGSPYVIGLSGSSPFAGAMAAVLKGKAIGGHGVDVRILSDATGPEVLRECHVLFLFGNDTENVRKKLVYARGASVLTVGEFPGFASAGGMIGFRIIDGNMRFEINNAAVREAGLTISSKLLKLATLVITKPQAK